MNRVIFVLGAIFLTNLAFGQVSLRETKNSRDFLYISGQFPIYSQTGQMADGDMETLTNLVIDNIQKELRKNDYKLKDLVKLIIYLTDIRDYDVIEAVFQKRLHFRFPPAWDVVAVPGLPGNARIEVSAIAWQ